jgi:hypothetical protein
LTAFRKVLIIKFPENASSGSRVVCRKIAKSDSLANAPKPYVVDYSSFFCKRKYTYFLFFLEILVVRGRYLGSWMYYDLCLLVKSVYWFLNNRSGFRTTMCIASAL